MTRNAIILTGERGVGKTTICQKTVALAQSKNYVCHGILTLSLPNGERDVVDVGSGDRRQLTVGPDAEQVVIQGRFRFDPETLAWGNRVLSHAHECQLLVIDELGPLEIERGGGWYKAFYALQRNDHALAVAVVRPELVIPAQLRLPGGAATVLTVTLDDRDDLPFVLIEILESEIRRSGNG
jgi:nucleoside-triphosphatase THEP1